MQKLVKEYLDELDRRQKKSRKIRIAVLLLAVIVVGSVAGILTQYGVAMTGKAKCGKEEHVHSESCYENVLICEKTEGEGHQHTEECRYPKELICGLEESEGHTHTEECLFPEELVCGLEESEEHQHTEECYQRPEGYACGLEESEGHQHTEECYQIPEGYACGLEEGEGHTHTEECYQKQLICEKEEHTHTDICYTDAAADVEDASVWDHQYAAVNWQGIWSADLVTAAQMQLGYQESANNYIITAEGIHKGYTRYGQFMGDPYIDWDAAFVNFCMNYAGLSVSGIFPQEADSAKWCEELGKIRAENAGYLTASGNYAPKAGDIVFFQKEGEETGSQMGIVSSYDRDTATVRVIEGNSGNEVRENAYNVGDSHIVSYLKITELEEAYKGTQGEPETGLEDTEQEEAKEPEDTMEGRTMTADGPDYTVTVSFTSEARIPNNAVLSVREIDPGSEEYKAYCRQSIQAMEIEEISFARYFDVTFLADGTEIEPSAPVDVKITYDEKFDMEEDAGANAVHFSKNGTEVLDAGINTEENSFTFTQNSFSVVGTVVAKANTSYYYKGGVPEDLDGKTFLLETLRNTEYIFLTGEETENAGGVKGLVGSAAENIASVENPDENKLWTFHRIDDTSYSIQNAALGTYLNINGSEVTLENEACGLTVETRDGRITIRNKKYFLEADGEGHILAAAKKEDELESYHKFRLFGAGREYSLTAEGEDYRITLELSALDGLFDDTEFTAEEITGAEAEVYAQKTQEALGIEHPGFQRFFHLGFDKEIPDDLIHVSGVTIQYKDNAEGFDINGAGGVVSFKDGAGMVVGAKEPESGEADTPLPEEVEEEVLDVTMDGLERSISAEISELSDLGIMMLASTDDTYYSKNIESVDDLDSGEFLIANIGSVSSCIMGNTIKDAWTASSGITGYNFAGTNFVNYAEGFGLWSFEKQENGKFCIRLANTDDYLNISGTNVTLGNRQELSVICESGKIIIGNNNSYLNSYGGGGQQKFAGWSNVNDVNSKMILYAKEQVSPLTLEVENVDEAGELITELEPNGTEPQIPRSVSVNLNNTNGCFIPEQIVKVESAKGDKGDYKYLGARIVYEDNNVKTTEWVQFGAPSGTEMTFYTGNGGTVTRRLDEVKIQFVYQVTRTASLEIEPSISTKNKINIRMINYTGQQFSGWEWSTNARGVKQGILKSYLDTNGYPSFAHSAGVYTGPKGNGSEFFGSDISTENLQPYFTGARDADNLFLKKEYDNSGYYAYNSLENGATFNETTGDFTLYKQLTTIRNTTYGEEDEKLCGKGHFLPYNTFEEKQVANIENIYDVDGNLMTDSSRYRENLFVPDGGSPDYYFGMEMTAEFYQMQNGMNGENPVRYTFTGDDDLWVYIDGVLVLDIGGCHDAKSGYIDFSTGQVKVDGVNDTTLYALFEDAYQKALNDTAASGEVIDELQKKLEPSRWKTIQKDGKECKIFADYTKHDFKMWYMERGGGASNLQVRFNLPLIPPGEVQIEKQLSNSEQGKYTNKAFDFQVYLQPIEGPVTGNGEDKLVEDAPLSDYRLLSQGLLDAGRTKATAFLVKSDGTEEPIDMPAGDGIITAGESKSTDGIFRLHPGEKLILKGLKENRKYYVRELNLNEGEYDGVVVDQIVVDSKNSEGNGASGGTEILTDPITGVNYVDTTVQRVSERAYVVFKNHCSEANSNALLIKKVMSGNSDGETYTFRIWLENHDGSLALYEGNYYVKSEDGKYYSREKDGTLEKTECTDALENINEATPRMTIDRGNPGVIRGISPGDTVIIRNLLAGTGFLVEEEDPGTKYETPRCVPKEGTFETSDHPAAVPGEAEGETSGEGQKIEMGSVKLGTNAEVTVYNEKKGERTWHIVKKSRTEGGPTLEAVFEFAPVKKDENDDRPTYYGKSLKENDGEITWYEDRECTKSTPISNLRTGKYQLKEIEAAPGYSLNSEVWEVEVEAQNGVIITGQQYEVKSLPSGSEGGETVTDHVYTFYNEPLYELPHAGGSGIYWYLIGGMLLMMAGALILYKNKCREVQGS